MKRKIKRILIIVYIILFFCENSVFAKYNYTYKLKAYSLSRDNSEIEYTINQSEKEYTNNDVLLTINLNKEVENIDGFSISEDKRKISKIVKENETNTIMLEDFSGNQKEISYTINNIDKEPPQIIGVENNTTYNTEVKINYMDNVGIKDIFVDKYSNLSIECYTDYFDTNFYKGINVKNDSIYAKIPTHPKNTYNYKYYINDVLKAQTSTNEYTYTGLSPRTTYTIKVEAIDNNEKVLETVSKEIKTKSFSDISSTKTKDSFSVTIHGIDSNIQDAVGIGFYEYNNQKIIEGKIDSNRNLSFTFSALDLTSTIEDGYYFFHIHLMDKQTGEVVEIISCDVIFGTEYVEKENIKEIYNLKENGNYQIIATDLAGNSTEKNITIKK